ncbi:hypothetical protein DFH27DRAFT_602286 [Peziza echinospora]|nr:hypothetical protein DFH27DRAFT_602286 [Peziza echinospora]
MVLISHMVLVSLLPSLSQREVNTACSRFLFLKKACISPKTGRPYIQSISGGADMSIENLAGNYTHGFLVTFPSGEDRDYYVRQDPAHAKFRKYISGLVVPGPSGILVLDYVDGDFGRGDKVEIASSDGDGDGDGEEGKEVPDELSDWNDFEDEEELEGYYGV